MANRVVLGKLGSDYVLRTSAPGHDVLTLPENSPFVTFDSRWNETGFVRFSGTAVADEGHSLWRRKAITFPSPFAKVPLVIVFYKDLNGQFALANGFRYNWGVNYNFTHYATLSVSKQGFELFFNKNTIVPFIYYVLDNSIIG